MQRFLWRFKILWRTPVSAVQRDTADLKFCAARSAIPVHTPQHARSCAGAPQDTTLLELTCPGCCTPMRQEFQSRAAEAIKEGSAQSLILD